MTTMDNELEQLMRGFDNGGFRVDALLKDGEHERTERVYWTKSGTDQGPFIRKIIKLDSGLGGAYEDVFAAQNSGVAFRHLPHIFDCRRGGDSPFRRYRPADPAGGAGVHLLHRRDA